MKMTSKGWEKARIFKRALYAVNLRLCEQGVTVALFSGLAILSESRMWPARQTSVGEVQAIHPAELTVLEAHTPSLFSLNLLSIWG